MVVKDDRISACRYLITDDSREIMQIPPEIRKCVAFVAREINGQMKFLGTCFFVCRPAAVAGRFHVYAVTAKHLFKDLLDGIDDVLIRLNEKSGMAGWASNSLSRWVSHPSDDTVDVAVTRIGMLHESWDHKAFPIERAVTETAITEHDIGFGEEVFLAGLFTEHHGTNKNIPIIRVGNISAMPEEKIYFNGQNIDAYLVECRSIGGLSGAPVFVNTGGVRTVDGTMASIGGPQFFLLGLMKGHWDANQTESVNMGIAVVVPVDKIIETLNHPDLLKADNFENEQLLRQHRHKDD